MYSYVNVGSTAMIVKYRTSLGKTKQVALGKLNKSSLSVQIVDNYFTS